MAVEYTSIDTATATTRGNVLTQEQTQSISQQTPGPIPYDPPASPQTQIFDDGSTLTQNTDGTYSSTDAVPVAAYQAGAAARGDDGTAPSAISTTVITNAASNLGNPVLPSSNVLDQYASYTYSLSWYLLTPAQYTTMAKSGKINTNSWSLLMQSGGAQVGGNRNKYFSLDYYMDNLEINSTFNNRGPSSFADLSFNVTEPNGITLLQNLNRAVVDFYKDSEVTANKAQYCMVIRFYGYDADGNLVTKVKPGAGTIGTTPNSSNVVVVKYFPFTINTFQFRVANKAVMYEIKGAPNSYRYGQGSALGSIPNSIELTGETVDEILNGQETTTVVPGEDGRGAKTKDDPASAPVKVRDLTAQQQAAIVTGSDPNTIDDYNGRAL